MTSRRTNALTGDRIHLLAAIGGTIQGGVLPPSAAAKLDIEAVGGGFIDMIDVVRGGRLWHRITPAITPAPISDDPSETVLYLELGWGARGTTHRWEGDLTLDGGEILGLEPRFRGSEVVSPLEGADAGHALPFARLADGSVYFAVTAEANPNNSTSATQGLALHLRADATATIRVTLSGQTVSVPASRLREGALAGNLGPIDSPAWRLHALPRAADWQWHGSVPLGPLADGESLYLRLRQRGGQMAWTSPLFCRG